ncbi:MAG: transcriptional regulator, partial [Paraburkholderia graminis]
LMCGDLGRAAVYLDIMRSQVALHGLDVWRDYCNCLSAHRDILDGQLQRGVALLESSLDALIARGFRRLITLFIAAYGEALVAAGRIDEAVRRLNDTLQFCENNGEMMFVPELWRVLGIAARARRRSADAEAHFTTAIQMARRQGATMWELRASLSLAALWREESRDAERHSHALHMLERLALCFDAPSNAADVRALFDTLSTMRGAERTVSTASPMLTSPAPLDARRKAARKPNASLARVD